MKNLKPNRKTSGGLSPAALAYFLPEVARTSAIRAAVLCANEDATEKMQSDLEFFSRFRSSVWTGVKLLRLRGWEQSPYRNLQPGLAARLERISSCQFISRQATSASWVLAASLPSFLQAAPAGDFLRETFSLRKGERIHPEEVCRRLVRFGYSRSDAVEDPGAYCLRGGILDVFPPSLDNPVRIEFFDEEIESIRVFNPETQRSIRVFSTGDSVDLIPAREFPSDPESLQLARERLKEWGDHHDLPRTARDRLSSLMSQGIVTQEMEYLIQYGLDLLERRTKDVSYWSMTTFNNPYLSNNMPSSKRSL
jgi:transcription-repair coupling factor (superfamily II helicase)